MNEIVKEFVNMNNNKDITKTSDYKSFAYLENGEIQYTEYETIKSVKVLDPGSYNITYAPYPVNKPVIKVNDYFEQPKTHNFSDKEKIDELLNSFFNKEVKEKIESLGFCHKTGILLHGIEGGGKSTIIKYYCNLAIQNQKAIVFHVLYKYPEFAACWDFIQNIRRIQKNPIIIVFDEFDEQMERNEALIKSILDGNLSISNCICFAATNYPDKIPKSISQRPSRFKYNLNIEGMQIIEDIINIMTPILKGYVDDKEMPKIANNLKGKTLDEIKQFCFDKLMEIKHYENKGKKIGFHK